MKYLFLFLSLSLLFIFSCQSSQEKPLHEVKEMKIDLPANLMKVMDAHGGLEKWAEMKSMSYGIKKSEKSEIQKIDLQTRKEVIEGTNYLTGRDDGGIWLKADSTYKGNPVFYHNLMFYFIAMPFVLADDGIVYSDVAPLNFEGIEYPGIRIGYADSIGFSPQDEYYIHYDPESHEMRWLGYTVTYFSKEKSVDIHWIRYNDWNNVNGVLLPNSLDWYKYENGLPTEFRNKVTLENMSVSATPFEDSIFEKVEGAEYQ